MYYLTKSSVAEIMNREYEAPQEIPKYSEKKKRLCHFHFVRNKSHMKLNLCFCSGRSVTKALSPALRSDKYGLPRRATGAASGCVTCLFNGAGKGKVHLTTGHECPERKYRYSSTLSLISALGVDGWSPPRPDRFTAGKETRYPLCRRLSGPQKRSGRVRKISPWPGSWLLVQHVIICTFVKGMRR
jgi:hypothetical protein